MGFDSVLFGTLTGIGLLIIPYLLGKMGAGDAKLLGAVGSFIGAKGVFISFLFTAVAGGIYALLIIFLYKNKFKGFFTNFYYSGVNFIVTRKFVSFENEEDIRQRPKLCYGLAIAAGTGIFMIFDGNRNQSFTLITGGQNEIVENLFTYRTFLGHCSRR